MYKIKYRKIFSYGMICIMFILVVLVFKTIEVYKVSKDIDIDIKEYDRKIAKVKKDLVIEKEKEEYYNSDEYIEKVAREKSNLVKKNDIIFITKYNE